MMDIDLFEQGRDIFSNQYVILALTFAVFFFIKTSATPYRMDASQPHLDSHCAHHYLSEDNWSIV